MSRDYARETEKRVAFLKKALENSGAKGFVYGNSGGKDSALVGILCRMASENTLGVVMPCSSARNYGEDRDDGLDVARQFDIATIEVDLTAVKEAELKAVSAVQEIADMAAGNIAPRLRMTTLYTIAQSRGCLVAGTGNRSEAYVGYFTKWGDGAYDINPIADLTVGEIYEFLRYLNAPANIISKAPSAGLFEGQTDEQEMGIKYSEIDDYLLLGKGDEKTIEIIKKRIKNTAHKRNPAVTFKKPE